MRAPILVKGCAAVFMLAAIACTTSRAPDEQASDARITTAVKSRLAADPELNPFEIDVDTQDGVTRLSGLVEAERERSHAAEIARKTEGVRRVQNDLKLGDQSFSEGASDAWIGTKVKSKLAADPQISAQNIDVDVLQGDVTLSGVVRSPEAKAEAERLARNTEGVRSVSNRLEVEQRRY